MNEKRKYDSTVARIAGNIAGHLVQTFDAAVPQGHELIAQAAVMLARAIVAEVERTEPKPAAAPPPDTQA
jgi:hypothetical protein